jgi:hypothetical protein
MSNTIFHFTLIASLWRIRSHRSSRNQANSIRITSRFFPQYRTQNSLSTSSTSTCTGLSTGRIILHPRNCRFLLRTSCKRISEKSSVSFDVRKRKRQFRGCNIILPVESPVHVDVDDVERLFWVRYWGKNRDVILMEFAWLRLLLCERMRQRLAINVKWKIVLDMFHSYSGEYWLYVHNLN